MPRSGTDAPLSPRVWRVSDLNRRVRGLLDADAALADVWVEGEVSQPSFPPSGHCFFVLKDANSQVRAVLFREDLERATVRPEHGAQLMCHGKVRAYEPQGVYQLYVESITPVGAGDLHAAVRGAPRPPRDRGPVRGGAQAAAAALAAADRGRHLPGGRGLALTSATCCAVATRSVDLVLSPTTCRGRSPRRPSCGRSIACTPMPGLDLVILARGGGSIEDLWGFNDEQVVRTVIALPRPGGGGGGPRERRDPGRLRRRPSRAHPVRRGRNLGSRRDTLPVILNRLAERSAACPAARLDPGSAPCAEEGRALAGLRPDLDAARQRAAELVDRGHRALAADVERASRGVRPACATRCAPSVRSPPWNAATPWPAVRVASFSATPPTCLRATTSKSWSPEAPSTRASSGLVRAEWRISWHDGSDTERGASRWRRPRGAAVRRAGCRAPAHRPDARGRDGSGSRRASPCTAKGSACMPPARSDCATPS